MEKEDERFLLYHGSAVPALTELQPLSQLHHSDQKVVYLSSNIPYVLLYIWSAEKTQYPQKWVTGWLKGGIAYYEEQFPGQLKAFYEGVPGYIYGVRRSEAIQSVPQREEMFYSKTSMPVYRATEIPDVYQALLRYEQQGLFRILRYADAPAERQEALVDKIAAYVMEHNLLRQRNAQSCFMKRYFVQAWNRAKEHAEGKI